MFIILELLRGLCYNSSKKNHSYVISKLILPWFRDSHSRYKGETFSFCIKPEILVFCIHSVTEFLGSALALFSSFSFPLMFSCLVTQSFPTHCDPMDCNMPGFPVLYCLLECAQTHVHWVSDAIQPSSVLNLFQHQVLFEWVSSSHQVANASELPPWSDLISRSDSS